MDNSERLQPAGVSPTSCSTSVLAPTPHMPCWRSDPGEPHTGECRATLAMAFGCCVVGACMTALMIIASGTDALEHRQRPVRHRLVGVAGIDLVRNPVGRIVESLIESFAAGDEFLLKLLGVNGVNPLMRQIDAFHQ